MAFFGESLEMHIAFEMIKNVFYIHITPLFTEILIKHTNFEIASFVNILINISF